MSYDNIKSHKEPGFQPLFRRYIFRKTKGGVEGGGGQGGQIDPPLPVLGLRSKSLHASNQFQKPVWQVFMLWSCPFKPWYFITNW